MADYKRRGRLLRLLAAVALGGSAFQLTGCDPAVRGALLGGLQTTTNALATTVIDAFFISLDDSPSGGSNP
ncbi:MAG: hypothetical protein ABIG44_18950 [Planctomycetota bacterium]